MLAPAQAQSEAQLGDHPHDGQVGELETQSLSACASSSETPPPNS